MHLRLWLLIAALTLTACTAGVKPTEAPLLLPPASLTTLPPEELPQPETAGLEDLYINHLRVAGMYHELREQLKGLVEWLEKTRELR
ncbi:hypothetical protein DLREEDagrD3_28790 [Denitratisoma sp. agr-D3]